MKKTILFVLLLTILIGTGSFLYRQNADKQQESQPRKVAVTIFPLYDIVRNIAGKEVQTVLVLDPGASPHSFDPSPEDIRKIQGADAIFMIDYGIDQWSSTLAQSADIKKQIIVDKNVTLREFSDDDHQEEAADGNQGEEGFDPHYWLSVNNARGIASQVKNELSMLYPEYEQSFETNFIQYEAELTQLDEEIRSKISLLENKNIATFHNAWGYFDEEYGITIVATFEEFPGEEPSPEYLQEFTEKVKESGVTVIFAEPQFSTSSLEPIAKDLNIRISQLAPEGMTGINSYTELMRYNVNQITQALQ